jgi:membrane associated rhomboid family serine protease
MVIVLCVLASLFFWSVNLDFIEDLLVFKGAEFFEGRFWTPVTAIFIHGDLVHLIGNMLFLYVFGNTLENEFGADNTLGVFFLGGVLSFIIGAFYYGMETVMIGASAAVFTLMAIVMLTKPLRFSWLFLMPLGLVALLYLLFNIAATYYGKGGGVGYLAHVIGFLVGFPFGVVWSRGKWIRNLLITVLILIVYLLLLSFLRLFLKVTTPLFI